MRLTFIFLMGITIGFSQQTEVTHLKINDKMDHFAATVKDGKVLFSTNLLTKRGKPVLDKYDGVVYNLFEGKMAADGEIEDVVPIQKIKTGRDNMSVSTMTKDGRFIYFTTNNQQTGDNKLKDIKTYNLQIQRAEFVDGIGWTNFAVLSFCHLDYNFAHPALSPDEKTLYFVANIGGTKGKSDIYKVSVAGHQSYGKVTRLNDEVNSSRTEMYPYVSPDNKLYFSSNRRGGVGGFDIYRIDLNVSERFQIPEVLPEPINSVGQDFSIFLNKDLKTGYLTSRRSRGSGNDDLYYFKGF